MAQRLAHNNVLQSASCTNRTASLPTMSPKKKIRADETQDDAVKKEPEDVDEMTKDEFTDADASTAVGSDDVGDDEDLEEVDEEWLESVTFLQTRTCQTCSHSTPPYWYKLEHCRIRLFVGLAQSKETTHTKLHSCMTEKQSSPNNFYPPPTGNTFFHFDETLV